MRKETFWTSLAVILTAGVFLSTAVQSQEPALDEAKLPAPASEPAVDTLVEAASNVVVQAPAADLPGTNLAQMATNEEAEATYGSPLLDNKHEKVTDDVVVESAASPGSDLNATAANSNLITIALNDVPVTDVVSMFSRISGANIIVCGNFTNIFVTANLKDVDWKSALNLTLGSVNLGMIEDPSGILMIVTMEKYKEKLRQIEETKPMETRIMTPRYVNVSDLIEQIKKLNVLSSRGTIIASQSAGQEKINLKSSSQSENIQNPGITTAIIVTDIKEYVEKVSELIETLDRREPQVFIEARIIDIVESSGKKTGFDWEMLDNFGVSAGLGDLKWTMSDQKSTANTRENADSQYDKRKKTDNIEKQYDANGQQIDPAFYDENGVPLGANTPTRTITDTIERGRDRTMDVMDATSDNLTEGKTATAILSVSEVSLFLSAIKRNSNSDMISHPLIVVGNRVEAKIHVGERYPTVTSTKQSANPQQGQTESFSETVEWNDLGLTLWVIPEIDMKQNVVRLTVNPSMSVWVKDIQTDAGSVLPVISTRHLSTRVNVPSSQTVAIGGLMENRKSKKEKRVPLLGDIPLLGLLFRHNEDMNEKHNLIILITPSILDELQPRTGLEDIAKTAGNEIENGTNTAAEVKNEGTNGIVKSASTPGGSQPAAVPVASRKAQNGNP